MAETSLDDCIPTIDAILQVSDLEKISVKKIRNALLSLFDTDFQTNKKQIQQLILQRYNLLLSKPAAEPTSLQDEIEKLRLQNEILVAQLHQASTKASTKTAAAQTKGAKRKRKTADTDSDKPKARETGLTQPMRLSPALAGFLGVEMAARSEVMKKMWVYIKEHQRQSPTDGRKILCDDKMRQVFGVDEMSMFTMPKYLQIHFIKPEGSAASPPSILDEPNTDLT